MNNGDVMNKFIYMTEEEMEFGIKDNRDLATWIGILRKRKILLDLGWSMLALFILEIPCILWLIKRMGLVSLLIPVGISFIIFIILSFLNLNDRKNKYYEAVKEKYLERTEEYDGFKLDIVGYKFDATAEIYSHNLLMATDGYKFIFMADPFIDSGYRYKDGRFLKVMSNNILDKTEFIIKLNDIKSFEYIKNKGIKTYDYLTTSFKMDDSIDLVIIVMNDFKKYELSGNFYKYLKDSIPTREIKK